ncbi:MAG: hypothetical protein LH610_12555 [Sphingomonas bacterium]|nr:hypothetical protein [Sphingomonas bacterium]
MTGTSEGSTQSRTGAEWLNRDVVLLAVMLMAIVPLLYPPVPPLIDVPGHMARYRVMLGTDAATLGQWYSFDWKLIGYLGCDLLVALIAPLIGLEPAVKLVTMIIVLVGSAGILSLSRVVHGRVQPSALFALPLIYHMTFLYGFLNYTLAMAAMLNALALWIWLGKSGRVLLRGMMFVPLSCLVWTCHVVGWMTLGLSIFAVEWVTRLQRGERLIHATVFSGLSCLPLALPMLVFLNWSPAGDEAGSDYRASLATKPLWLVSVLRDRWQLLDLASIAIFLMVFYYGWRSPGLRYSRPLLMAAAGLFLMFLAMPFLAAYADARLAPYIFIFALVALGSASASRPADRLFAIAGLAFLIIRMTATTISLAIESDDWKKRLVALDHIPYGSTVAALSTMQCKQGWRMERTGHIAGMAVVRRASFTNDQYALGDSALLTVKGQAFGRFALDPSQIVVTRPCGPRSTAPTLSQSLRDLPRDQFDMVWLMDPGPHRGITDGLDLVWSDGRDAVFQVRQPARAVARPPLSR